MSYWSVFSTCDLRAETDFERIANLPDESLPQMVDVTPPGVYFGYAQISANGSDGTPSGTLDEGRTKVHPMVMSLGWNPFYKNEKLTAVRRNPAVPSSLLHVSWASERRRSTSCIPSTLTFMDTR